MDTITWFFIGTTVIAFIGIIVLYLKKKNENSFSDSGQSDQIHTLKEQLQGKASAYDALRIEYETHITEKEKIILSLNGKKNLLSSQIADLQDFSTSADTGSLENDVTETHCNDTLNTQILKLKKQIDDLQSDLEDAEEDAAKHKKILRQKTTEFEIDSEKLTSDLKYASIQLEEKEAKLEAVSGSLKKKENNVAAANSFLEAKPIDNEHTKEFNEAVSKIENFVDGSLLPALQSARELDEGELKYYNEMIWNWANLQKKTWLQRKKAIAFVGEFSAGKTSIINRVLTMDDPDTPKLPVSSKATTAIATYISYDMNFSSQFTDANGVLKSVDREVFESVKKDLFSDIKLSSLIQYFVISYKNENLKNISILDTPGFSSNDLEDAVRTAEVIREADALFWVFDANSGDINQASLDIIKKHLADLPLYVVINKADTKSPNELDDLESHIRNTVINNDISVNGFLRFSQNHSADELLGIISQIPNRIQKDELAEIYKKLTDEIGEAEQEYEKELTNFRMLRNHFRESEQNIEVQFKAIERTTEDILAIPQKKDKWLSSGYYRMNVEEFNGFEKKIDEIVTSNAMLSELYDDLRKDEIVKKMEISQTVQKQELNQLSEFRKLQKELDQLIESWDPSYRNRLHKY